MLSLAIALLALVNSAFAATATLSFSSNDATNWAGGIATDGQGGSVDFPGVAIQVLDISDTSGTNVGVPIEWHSDVELGNSESFSGLTSFDATLTNTGWKGIAIRSALGNEFGLTSFRWYDWGWAGGTVNVIGYRDGTQVASTSFTANSTDAIVSVTPGSGFANVDEVRITYATSGWPSINDIAVADVGPGTPTAVTATAGNAQATVTFTAPSSGSQPIATYTATSNPGALTGSCAGPAACTITVAGLTNGTAYSFTVFATSAAGTGSSSAPSNVVTPKGSQTITFNNPGTQNFGTAPTLTATASSGLAVTFTSSTTGVCTVTSGGASTFVATGTCTINADQAGNGAFLAAPTVTQSFAVNAVVPGAPTIGTATAGDTQATVSFSAPASNGGAAVTGYTVTSNPGGNTATGASSPITVTGLTNGLAYTFTVTASNIAGTGAASAASNSVTPKGAQTITFSNPGAQNFGTAPVVTATASSGLAVSFTSSTTGVCTITSGGALTFVTSGTCTINADQAGNGAFLAAPTVSRSFTVNAVVPGAPTIGTATAGDTQATVSFSPPAFTGGAAITGYTVTSNPGGITAAGASSSIVVTGLTNGTAYTFTVTATNSAGTGAASAASNSITPKAAQTITFGNPGAQNFGTTPTLAATASSGLAVTFTSSTAGVCTITSGGAVTFIAAGTCTIDADQAGNGAFLAATTVTRSFTVNAVVPGAPTIGTATPGNSEATVSFTPPASTGGAPITSYTVACNPGAATASGSASPITVTGLVLGTTYACSVTATNSAGTGAASATVSVAPLGGKSYSGLSPTGTGTIVATFTGGGATCAFSRAQFIPVSGDPASPPTAPAGVTFPRGLFDFATASCTPGSSITMTITWPSTLAPGTRYYKYGPTASLAAPHWYTIPVTVSGGVTTFTITDGGLGDDDLAANGAIADQGGPGLPGTPVAPTPVPTLSEWAMILLGLLLVATGAARGLRLR